MTSYCLDQRFLGGFVTYQLQKGKLNFVTGLHANTFKSDHFMEVNWANNIPFGIKQNHQVYFNTGFKKELSAFAKFNFSINEKTSLFADLQMRTVSFKYRSTEMQYRPNDGQVEDMYWTFFNPKIGSRMVLSKMFSLYAMAGYSQREPTRFDYLQDDFAPRDIKQNEINPEQVLDLEVGTEFNGKVKGKVNLFAMEFQNQIVSTGVLNNFGYPVTGNVGRSYRRGVEMDLNGKLFSNLGFWLNSSISKNAILQLNQTYYSSDLNSNQTIEYRNTSLALSPNQIHNIGLESNLLRNHLLIAATYRYVGLQYLDNTQNINLSIPSFQTMDVQIAFDPKTLSKIGLPKISFRINNVIDAKYAPSGSVGGYNIINNNGERDQYALLFPAANRNLFCTLNWAF
jgi:iron complex outermembrane receptor protein